MRRSRRRGRCRPTAGCSGWSRARRSARSRPCSREVRGMVYARAKAQEAGYGLETELAEPDGALVSARSGGGRRARSTAEAAGGAWRGGSKRCSRMRPTGSIRRRARGSKARSAAFRGGARRSRRGSPCSARIGGEADPEFVDWLAVERVDGREYDVAIHRRWLDPTKPLARAVLAPGRRRAGHLGDAARRRGLAGGGSAHRRGAPRRAGRAFRGGQPVRLCRLLRSADRHRRQARATSPRWPAPMRG